MAHTEQSTQKFLAVIREQECIGCTKCIDACPVDAILGSAKHMHTVIAAECIGCKLCIAPCPVDCIDLITSPTHVPRIPAEHVKKRYQARKSRLQKQENTYLPLSNELTNKKNYLADALARVKKK